MRQVTERDLRMPEFRDAKPEDLEFREDGKLVRKDRWEVALRNVVSAIGWARREFEVHEVSAEVARILELAEASVKPKALKALKAEALQIFDGPECPQEVRDAIEWFASSIDTILADEDGVMAVDPVQAERERCAAIADDEARIRTEAGQQHSEDSEARGRCFAAARAAMNVAKGIRSGEVVAGVEGRKP